MNYVFLTGLAVARWLRFREVSGAVRLESRRREVSADGVGVSGLVYTGACWRRRTCVVPGAADQEAEGKTSPQYCLLNR